MNNPLTKEELDIAINALPGEKVNKDYIESRIISESYVAGVGGPTVTVRAIVLDNGFSVRGESACVDPANFNTEIGRSIARKNAFDKLWPLFGFLLAEKRHLRSKV